jgi:hypothetical protein
MLAFKDFAPQQTAPSALFKAAEFESLEAVVAAVNAWIEIESIAVVNVETVVLPNLLASRHGGTADPNVAVMPGFAGSWNQFVRVWYRVSK